MQLSIDSTRAGMLTLLRLDFDDQGCGGPVSERTIAHRLAVHLEQEFRDRKLNDS